MSTTQHQPAPDYGEPFKLPLRYDPESDWGWIRDADNATACLVRKPLDEREASEYRRIREDPMKDRAERIVACVNACAGMTDPAAEIQAMRRAIKNASHFAGIILHEAGKQWQATTPLPDVASIEAVAQQIEDELQPFIPKETRETKPQ